MKVMNPFTKREETLVRRKEGSSVSVEQEDRDPDDEDLDEDAIDDKDIYRGRSNRVLFHLC